VKLLSFTSIYNYDEVNENSASENDENSEPINFDDTEGEEYEEVEGINNVWE